MCPGRVKGQGQGLGWIEWKDSMSIEDQQQNERMKCSNKNFSNVIEFLLFVLLLPPASASVLRLAIFCLHHY
eukprot:scaffold4738_cov61-Cyclotella_meneghiniana.AAC.6